LRNEPIFHFDLVRQGNERQNIFEPIDLSRFELRVEQECLRVVGGERVLITMRWCIDNAHSYRLYQYGDRCSWMRNSKFLRELENDNVDSEIVSEELRCLQDDEQPRSAHALTLCSQTSSHRIPNKLTRASSWW